MAWIPPLLKKSTGQLGKTQSRQGLGQPGSGVIGRVEWIRLGASNCAKLLRFACGNPGNENMIDHNRVLEVARLQGITTNTVAHGRLSDGGPTDRRTDSSK